MLLVAAGARPVLPGPDPEKRRLMPEHTSLGVEGVEAQGNVYGQVHDHGAIGVHRHRSDRALRPWAHRCKNTELSGRSRVPIGGIYAAVVDVQTQQGAVGVLPQ